MDCKISFGGLRFRDYAAITTWLQLAHNLYILPKKSELVWAHDKYKYTNCWRIPLPCIIWPLFTDNHGLRNEIPYEQ